MSGYFTDLLGTLRNSLRVGKATVSSSGLTANRTFELPDSAGMLALAIDRTYTASPGNGATVTLDVAAYDQSLVTVTTAATLAFTGMAAGRQHTIGFKAATAGISVTHPALKWLSATVGAGSAPATSGMAINDYCWITYWMDPGGQLWATLNGYGR